MIKCLSRNLRVLRIALEMVLTKLKAESWNPLYGIQATSTLPSPPGIELFSYHSSSSDKIARVTLLPPALHAVV